MTEPALTPDPAPRPTPEPIPDAWAFGPWSLDIDPAERTARLRALAVAARLIAGPRTVLLRDLLKRAEDDTNALVLALRALLELGSIDRRRILASGCSPA